MSGDFATRNRIVAAIIVLLTVVSLASFSITASQPEQATPAGTAATPSATIIGNPAISALATLEGDEPYPPCPKSVIQRAAIIGGGATVTPATTPGATATATSVATAQATETPVVVGPFEKNNGCVLIAHLRGDQAGPNTGDPKGDGTVIITIARPAAGPGQVCFQMQVSGIQLPGTAAHIHQGPVSIVSEIAVPLSAPDAQGKAEGCTNNVSRALAKTLLLYSSDYYVTVLNADFPDGALRGQLIPLLRLP